MGEVQIPDIAQRQVSFIDILSIIIRRWRVFATAFAGVVLMALLYVIVVPKEHRYFGSLSIGVMAMEDGVGAIEFLAIESPATVVARITNVYAPTVSATREELDGRRDACNLEVVNPRDTTIIVLECFAPATDAVEVQEFIKEVGNRILDVHGAMIAATQKRYGAQLDNVKVNLAEVRDNRLFDAKSASVELKLYEYEQEMESLKEDRRLLDQQLKMIDVRSRLVSQELEQLDSTIATADSRLDAADDQASDPTRAMALLLISTQIERMRERHEMLITTLKIELPTEAALLQKKIGDNERRLETLKEEVSKLRLDLTALNAQRELNIEKQQAMVSRAASFLSATRPTEWIHEPSKDFAQGRPRAAIVIGLGVVLGIVVGALISMVTEFTVGRRVTMEKQ